MFFSRGWRLSCEQKSPAPSMISPVFMIQALGRSRPGFEFMRFPAPIRRPRRSFTFSHSVLENACRSSKLYWSLKPPLTMGYLKHFEAILSFCFFSKLKQSLGDLWFVQSRADSEALSKLLVEGKGSS